MGIWWRKYIVTFRNIIFYITLFSVMCCLDLETSVRTQDEPNNNNNDNNDNENSNIFIFSFYLTLLMWNHVSTVLFFHSNNTEESQKSIKCPRSHFVMSACPDGRQLKYWTGVFLSIKYHGLRLYASNLKQFSLIVFVFLRAQTRNSLILWVRVSVDKLIGVDLTIFINIYNVHTL